MQKAIIIEGKPHCPRCGQRDYSVANYSQVMINNKSYTSIVARCVCGNKFHYCADIKVQNTKYFAVDEQDEREIKE